MASLEMAVVGAGSYGTCLAMLAARSGHHVTLWCRSPELASELTAGRENTVYLPGHALPQSVVVTTDLARAVAGKAVVLGVTPSHTVREVFSRAVASLASDTIVVNAAKGLEEGTLARVEEIYAEVLPAAMFERAVYLSGPTFAKEVAANLPSAIVCASRDPSSAAAVQAALSNDRFRAYTSDDVVGVQVGGALKNVIAIAAGISDGLGLGDNARAALITRGLAEIARMGTAMGANPLTFAGLSGLGDLVLTCAGDKSRNRRVGLALGRGEKLADIISHMRMVAEGVKTTRVAHDLAAKLAVDAPITDVVFDILYQDRPAADAMVDLMTRELRAELD
ncbi:MAG TPA: NAD(P)H-dependent glycerol-3-phosphate dehydrogenase [Kofleriaceae bacterium]|nr:NAD(P)H-dependent glycerol-3-phosphate dehydrogenase [Kofleriaceae bacterium]